MSDVLWSILVPTIPVRWSLLQLLTINLHRQIDDKPIELLVFGDNKKRSVGSKRNALLDMARGKYLSFIDDDDEVSENYISEILDRIYMFMEGHTADVICFKQKCIHVANGYEEDCTYSLKYSYQSGKFYDPGTGEPTNKGYWMGLPAHTMVWKSDIAKQGRFPDKNYGEDVGWVQQVCKLAKTEVQIKEELYIYKFSEKTTETRG